MLALIVVALPTMVISAQPTEVDSSTETAQAEKIVYAYFTSTDDYSYTNLSVMRLKIVEDKVIAYTFNTLDDNAKWYNIGGYDRISPTKRDSDGDIATQYSYKVYLYPNGGHHNVKAFFNL